MKTYDIFISYRRDGGVDSARTVQLSLETHGFQSIFFDYESIRNGVFDKQITDSINKCKDFILILSKGSLDRCVNQEDWVATEIRTALSAKCNIIPLVTEDFNGFPTKFPKDLEKIKAIQQSKLMKDEFFNASIDKLIDRLKSKPVKSPKIKEYTKKAQSFFAKVFSTDRITDLEEKAAVQETNSDGIKENLEQTKVLIQTIKKQSPELLQIFDKQLNHKNLSEKSENRKSKPFSFSDPAPNTPENQYQRNQNLFSRENSTKKVDEKLWGIIVGCCRLRSELSFSTNLAKCGFDVESLVSIIKKAYGKTYSKGYFYYDNNLGDIYYKLAKELKINTGQISNVDFWSFITNNCRYRSDINEKTTISQAGLDLYALVRNLNSAFGPKFTYYDLTSCNTLGDILWKLEQM